MEKMPEGVVDKKYFAGGGEGNLLANPGFLYILGSCFAAEKAMAVQYTGKGRDLVGQEPVHNRGGNSLD